MLQNNITSTAPTPPTDDPCPSLDNGVSTITKRKRKPAGTPDPDAEVVSLSPRTLLESDRYICEICNQGFQRDQNLQMHRRRHKVPWKLLKKETTEEVRKRVYVCPEPSCLHHNPSHALGDLVGIKKHFRRKHSNQRHWVCEKCSKGYAVQSDYKAHLKTCGTKGHSCDCGRVFSRVESFIEHQDACTMRRTQQQPELQAFQPAAYSSSRTASSTSPSSDANFSFPTLPGLTVPSKPAEPAVFLFSDRRHDASILTHDHHHHGQQHDLELQLLLPPSTTRRMCSFSRNPNEGYAANLKLSIGSSSSSGHGEENGANKLSIDPSREKGSDEIAIEAAKLKELANEQLRLAMAERAYAEEARQEAKRQIEMAEMEFANAKRIRQQALTELEKAKVLREEATKKISSTVMKITCQSCKQQFRAPMNGSVAPPADDETSLALSYMSSATTTEGDGE